MKAASIAFFASIFLSLTFAAAGSADQNAHHTWSARNQQRDIANVLDRLHQRQTEYVARMQAEQRRSSMNAYQPQIGVNERFVGAFTEPQAADERRSELVEQVVVPAEVSSAGGMHAVSVQADCDCNVTYDSIQEPGCGWSSGCAVECSCGWASPCEPSCGMNPCPCHTRRVRHALRRRHACRQTACCEPSCGAPIRQGCGRLFRVREPGCGFDRCEPGCGFSHSEPSCGFQSVESGCGFTRLEPGCGFTSAEPGCGFLRR